MKKLLYLLIVFTIIFSIYDYKHEVIVANVSNYANGSTTIELLSGTYTSSDGHTLVVNGDGTALYDGTYSLTVTAANTGYKITGKIGTNNKAVTFYQVSDSSIISGGTINYTHDGATVYLYDYTVFETIDTSTASETGVIEVWSNNTKVNAFDDLQSAVDISKSGDIIKITKDIDLVGGAYITGKNITIDGNNHTLNIAGWLGSVLVVEDDATLSINNLTIEGGATGFKVNYDAINVFVKSTSIPLVSGSDTGDVKRSISPIISKGNLEFYNSTINNNYVNGNGGAINVVSGNLTLNKSVLNHNRATRGGAIYIGSNIKQLQTDYSVKKVVMNDSTISSSYSSNGGAIFLYNTGEVKLNDTKFINNTVTGGKGGAILVNNQSSGEYYSMLEKLKLDFTNFTIDNCIFEGNWVGNDGAAIENHEAELNIKNTIFRKNVGIHYSSSCGTVSSYMDYPHEIANSIDVNFDNCLFEDNIGSASTIGDHGSSNTMKIFNTKFKGNKATYNSILLYSSDVHFKNCVFEDEYVSRGVVDVQSYNQEVEFEGKPATIIFENVEFKNTKNSSTDILIRRKDAQEINIPWTVIFKGNNVANMDIWHKNNIIIEGNIIGRVNTDSTMTEEDIVVSKNANVDNMKINKDKVLVSVIYFDLEKADGYNWESRKYLYLEEKTYDKKEFFLKHLISEDGYELKLYSDAAYTIPWDYTVVAADVDTIKSYNVYGRFEEHEHTYDGSLVLFDNAIYEQCECGYIGKKLSLELPDNTEYTGEEIAVNLINELNLTGYTFKYQSLGKDGNYVDMDSVPVKEGKYRAVLTYNGMSVVTEYVITNNPDTEDNIINVLVILSILLICLITSSVMRYRKLFN